MNFCLVFMVFQKYKTFRLAKGDRIPSKKAFPLKIPVSPVPSYATEKICIP